MLKTIIEGAPEKQKDLYICFVDFEKVFDMVRNERLVRRLVKLGIDAADLRVLMNLYWDQKAVVKIGDVRSGLTETRRGVRPV